MAMRILPAFLMSSRASACARDMVATNAAMASTIQVAYFFNTASSPIVLFLAFGIHDRELGHATTEFLGSRERRAEVGCDQILGQPRTDNLGADAHDIDVVVFDALVRGVDIMAHRSP